MNLLYDTKKDVVIFNQLKKDINTQCVSYLNIMKYRDL